MSERRSITVNAYSEDVSGVKLLQLIANLEQVAAQIPDEFRAAATVEIETDYESSYGTLDVDYSRPETDEEVKVRGLRDEAYKARQLQRERAEYERLKARFEVKA